MFSWSNDVFVELMGEEDAKTPVLYVEKWWFFTAEKREEPWSLKRIVTRSFISMVTVAMFN